MKDPKDLKFQFWPYDLFGYLMPGFVLVSPLIEFDSEIRSLFRQRFSEGSILDVLALIGIMYIAGHVVASLSSLILERGILKITCGYPGHQLFVKPNDRKSRAPEWLWRLVPGYCRSYPDAFIDHLFNLYNSVFKQYAYSPVDSITADNIFWNCSLYVSIHHPPGFQLAQHFVELYGFARNTCMSLLIISLYPLLNSWNSSGASLPSLSDQAWWLLTLSSAVFMYINYAKLLRRQSDHVFRAFFVSASHKRTEDSFTQKVVVTS